MYLKVEKDFIEVHRESSELKCDVGQLKSELDSFTSEIQGVLRNYAHAVKSEVADVVSVGSQTIVTHKPRVLPTPVKDHHSEYSNQENCSLQCRSAQTSLTNLAAEADEQAEHFRRKEDGYKRDLFELKVKLKELEAKMIHLKRKAEQIKSNVPVEIPPEGFSNEKVLYIYISKSKLYRMNIQFDYIINNLWPHVEIY